MSGEARDFAVGARWPGVAKTIEELGELSQVLGKLVAFPDGEHPDEWEDDQPPLIDRVAEEIADVFGALDFLVATNPELSIRAETIRARGLAKRRRFDGWQTAATAPTEKEVRGTPVGGSLTVRPLGTKPPADEQRPAEPERDDDPNRTERLTLRLTPRELQRLRLQASQEERSIASVVRRAIAPSSPRRETESEMWARALNGMLDSAPSPEARAALKRQLTELGVRPEYVAGAPGLPRCPESRAPEAHAEPLRCLLRAGHRERHHACDATVVVSWLDEPSPNDAIWGREGPHETRTFEKAQEAIDRQEAEWRSEAEKPDRTGASD